MQLQTRTRVVALRSMSCWVPPFRHQHLIVHLLTRTRVNHSTHSCGSFGAPCAHAFRNLRSCFSSGLRWPRLELQRQCGLSWTSWWRRTELRQLVAFPSWLRRAVPWQQGLFQSKSTSSVRRFTFISQSLVRRTAPWQQGLVGFVWLLPSTSVSHLLASSSVNC